MGSKFALKIDAQKVSKHESLWEGPGRGGCEKPAKSRPGRGQGDTRIFDIITNIGVSFLVSKLFSEILGAQQPREATKPKKMKRAKRNYKLNEESKEKL